MRGAYRCVDDLFLAYDNQLRHTLTTILIAEQGKPGISTLVSNGLTGPTYLETAFP